MSQDGGYLLVDSGLADPPLSGHAGGCAENQGGELHRVHAQIEDPPTAPLGVVQPVVRIERLVESKVGLYQLGLADGLLTQQVGQHPIGGEEPAPHGLHQQQSPLPGGIDHALALVPVERERLLAQHGLARLQKHERILLVAGLGGGHIHGVHSRVGGQLLVAAVGGRGPVLGGEIPGPVGRARPNGVYLGVVQQLEPIGKPNGDTPRPGDSPSNSHGGTLPHAVGCGPPLLWAVEWTKTRCAG